MSENECSKPLKIIIGASSQAYPDWIQTQEEELNLLDRADWEESFKSRKIRTILAEHVWEHLSYEEGVEAAKICYDFLEPEGYIRCAVPDAFLEMKSTRILFRSVDPAQKNIQLQVIRLYIIIRPLQACSKKQDSRLSYWNTVTKVENFILITGILKMVSFIDLFNLITETTMMNWDSSH